MDNHPAAVSKTTRSRSNSAVRVKIRSKSVDLSDSISYSELSADVEPEITDNYTEFITKVPLSFKAVPEKHKSLTAEEMKKHNCQSITYELYTACLCSSGVFVYMFDDEIGGVRYIYDYGLTVGVKTEQNRRGIKFVPPTEVKYTKVLEIKSSKEINKLAGELLIQNIRVIGVSVGKSQKEGPLEGQLLVNGDRTVYLLTNTSEVTKFEVSATLIKTKLRSAARVPTVYDVEIVSEIEGVDIEEFKSKVLSSILEARKVKIVDNRYNLIVNRSDDITVRLSLSHKKLGGRVAIFPKFCVSTRLVINGSKVREISQKDSRYEEFLSLYTDDDIELPMEMTVVGTVLGIIANGIFNKKHRKLVHMLVVYFQDERFSLQFMGDEKDAVAKFYDLGLNVGFRPKVSLLYEITDPNNIDIHNAIMLEKFL